MKFCQFCLPLFTVIFWRGKRKSAEFPFHNQCVKNLFTVFNVFTHKKTWVKNYLTVFCFSVRPDNRPSPVAFSCVLL